MDFILESSAFGHGMEIPARYTCKGDDISPPLQWRYVPEDTRSLVLIVDDPDAPDPQAPKRVWVHWLLYNIPSDTRELAEGITSERLPRGTGEGINDWQRTGYGGPCPPIGRHRYFHKLYALDCTLEGLNNPTRAELESAMHGHIIAQAELVGMFSK
jgi:Raf kinase inhibitor-like YbhB/YbcL family protein